LRVVKDRRKRGEAGSFASGEAWGRDAKIYRKQIGKQATSLATAAVEWEEENCENRPCKSRESNRRIDRGILQWRVLGGVGSKERERKG